MKLVISGKFDSLNKLIGTTNYNKFAGAGIKKRNQQLIVQQLTAVGLHFSTFPKHGIYTFTWHRSDKREDPDNIASAVKYFFDAFQEVGLIPNDNWEYVYEIHHRYRNDASKGYEFVEIEVVSSEEDIL